MANKKKNKYPVQHKTLVGAKDHYVVKNGDYDGSGSSDEFAVYGHSTGSANTEMEEMSLQLTRDVGGEPDYQMDSGTSWDEEDDLDDGPGFGDLGGPEFYGNKPSLLKPDKNSPLYRAPAAAGHIGLWSALGIAGAAALTAIGFIVMKNKKTSRKASATRVSTRTASHAGARSAAALPARETKSKTGKTRKASTSTSTAASKKSATSGRQKSASRKRTTASAQL